MLDKIPTLRAWATSVEAEALHRLAHDQLVPGFKLVEGRAHRKWVDADMAQKILLTAGLDPEVVTPRSFLSPAQIEKLLKKSKKFFTWDNIAHLVTHPVGKLAIAPESDPRPAVTRGAEFLEQTDETDNTDLLE